MGLLSTIGQKASQIGKAINEKIAGFEKATKIDIPFVGATKEEISKAQTPSTKTPAPTPTNFTPAPASNYTPAPAPAYTPVQAPYTPASPKTSPTSPSSASATTTKTPSSAQSTYPGLYTPASGLYTPATKTYRVELGTQANLKQIEEIKRQVGGGRVVMTETGNIAVEFESANPPKEVQITPYEEIVKQQEQEKLKQQASEIYERASPLEKIGIHAHALFSGKAPEYLWSALPGGKSPTDVAKEKLQEAIKTPQPQYVVETVKGAVLDSPLGIIGTSLLIGGVVGKLATKGAVKLSPYLSKIPGASSAISKTSQTLSRHSSGLTAVATGGAVGLEMTKITYMDEYLRALGVSEEAIKEKIGTEVSRDILAISGFTYGLKYGLDSGLPEESRYIIGARVKESRTRLSTGKEEGLPDMTYSKIKIEPKTEKFIEPQPAKEWLEGAREGKIIEETPFYVIKEHKGRQFVIAREPPLISKIQPLDEKGFIDVLRVEKEGHLEAGAVRGERYAVIDIYARKGSQIPVSKQKPSTGESEITIYKPSGRSRNTLKEMAEYYKSKQAEEITPTKSTTETLKGATEPLKGAKEVETKEVSSGGLKLLTEKASKETDFVETEEIYSPIAFEVISKPSVSVVSPVMISALIPRTTKIQKTREITTTLSPQLIAPPELKIQKTREITTTLSPPRIVPREPTPTTPLINVPKLITRPIETTTLKPIEIVPTITTPKIPPPLTPEFPRFPPTTPPTNFVPPPILFPEFPKGSVSKTTLEDLRTFKQMTKYEPSLLGVLLGKRKRGGEEFFTGFEIRGI
jgi:hypothetical protein